MTGYRQFYSRERGASRCTTWHKAGAAFVVLWLCACSKTPTASISRLTANLVNEEQVFADEITVSGGVVTLVNQRTLSPEGDARFIKVELEIRNDSQSLRNIDWSKVTLAVEPSAEIMVCDHFSSPGDPTKEAWIPGLGVMSREVKPGENRANTCLVIANRAAKVIKARYDVGPWVKVPINTNTQMLSSDQSDALRARCDAFLTLATKDLPQGGSRDINEFAGFFDPTDHDQLAMAITVGTFHKEGWMVKGWQIERTDASSADGRVRTDLRLTAVYGDREPQEIHETLTWIRRDSEWYIAGK